MKLRSPSSPANPWPKVGALAAPGGGGSASRLYFPSSGAAAVNPAFDAAWTDTAVVARLACVTAKLNTGSVAQVGGGAVFGLANALLAQYVSAPLAAQELAGSVKGQFVCGEYDVSVNACAQLVIRVVSGDGSVVRGTLLSAHAEPLSSEWGLDNAPKNRKFPLAAISPVTMSSVTAQAGDRLVIEIGARAGDDSAEQTELVTGDGLGADLPEDETTGSGIGDPWIEFSAAVEFQ